MYTSLTPAESIDAAGAFAVALHKGATRDRVAGLPGLPDAVVAAVAAALDRSETSLDRDACQSLYAGEQRILLLGLGDDDQPLPRRTESLRRAAGVLVRQADKAHLDAINIILDASLLEAMGPDAAARAVGEGAALGNLSFNDHKGAAQQDSDEQDTRLKLHADRAMATGLSIGIALGESTNLARKLAATPPNIANTDYLITFCRWLAEESGLSCKVIDAVQAEQLNMGGLLAVGRAGSTPPAVIILEHKPRGTAKQKPVMIVGKAVTFDTGGYSIKPKDGMAGMKYDKCGGIAVIGAMHAIASLDLKQHVVALIPTAENMISDDAMRVDDILTMHNGVTVEVTNTDAEGRLILADALAYGCKQYGPAAVLDLATLTGGVVVALGNHCAGVFVNDEALETALMHAADDTGERLWKLPLWEEHRDLLKANHCDIVNSAGRKAHAIQGAAFLSFFVGDDATQGLPTTPWAHLDIAGMSDVEKATPLYDIGPTGYGVRLLARYVEDLTN